MLLDPKVSEATARACQMAHRLGLARAEGRPKISANITGSRQIVGRIKEIPRGRTVIEDGRVRTKTPHGAEEIRRSGAHTREFDHREKNNIYDGKVSVRHTFIDWGQRSNRTEARSLALQAARIDALGVMRERGHELVRLSLLLRRAEEVIAVQKANFSAVETEVDAVRARVEAGVGRMSDLREAQLVALDQEIGINRSEAERDQILEGLAAEFDLDDSDARHLVQVFLARRPAALAVLQADCSDKAHAIRLRTREVTHEADEIRGSRYPKLDGVLEGTIFDMTDYEDEYEVVGKVEMTMPLYDGGTARARLRETAWRARELKSSLEALSRAHNREMEGLAQRFNQLTREESEALARRDELQARLRSLQQRQGKTISSPLALARVRAEIGAADVLARFVARCGTPKASAALFERGAAWRTVHVKTVGAVVQELQPNIWCAADVPEISLDPTAFAWPRITQMRPFYETVIAIPEVVFTKSPDTPVITCGRHAASGLYSS